MSINSKSYDRWIDRLISQVCCARSMLLVVVLLGEDIRWTMMARGWLRHVMLCSKVRQTIVTRLSLGFRLRSQYRLPSIKIVDWRRLLTACLIGRSVLVSAIVQPDIIYCAAEFFIEIRIGLVARICRSQSSKDDQFRQGRGSIPRFGIIILLL